MSSPGYGCQQAGAVLGLEDPGAVWSHSPVSLNCASLGMTVLLQAFPRDRVMGLLFLVQISGELAGSRRQMHFLLTSISTPQADGCRLSLCVVRGGVRGRGEGVQVVVVGNLWGGERNPGRGGEALGPVGTLGTSSVHGVSGGRAGTSDGTWG